MVGALPSGLPAPYWPGALPWSSFSALVMPVLVVTFIALLELTKEGLLDVTQAEAYAPLYVRLAYTPLEAS